MSLSAAHYSLGLEFHRNEQFAEAARCYGNVLKLEPQHADARKYLAVVEFNLGAEAQRNGDLTEAEARYRASLQADVDLLPPRHNLARVAQALMAEPGHSERAFSCFRTSLLLDDEQSAQIGSRPQAYIECAGRAYTILLCRLGRDNDAIDYVRSLCDLSGHAQGMSSQLEELLYRNGRTAEAFDVNRSAFEQAVRLQQDFLLSNPENPAMRMRLESMLGNADEITRSRLIFEQFHDLTLRDEEWCIDRQLAAKMFHFPHGADAPSMRATIERAGAALAAPAIAARRNRLVAIMLARDEIDVLRDAITCHLNQGVDLVLVTDNGSIDGSREMLADLERSAPVQILDEPKHNHDQALWMTRMIHLARDQHGAEWVICADADEVWLAADYDLHSAITHDATFYGDGTQLLFCNETRMVPERADADKPGYRPTDARLALIGPLKRPPELIPPDDFYYGSVHKCIVRTERFAALWHGNHYASFDGPARYGYSQAVRIMHFHMRTRQHLRRKLQRTFDAISRNPAYLKQEDRPVRMNADERFENDSYPTPFYEHARTIGRLVEIDGITRLRDHSLPARPSQLQEPDELRRAAMDYLCAIEPSLLRAGNVVN